MKRSLLGIAAMCSLMATHAQASQPNVEVIDQLITHIYKSLAQRQGFNVLSAPDEGAAKIGSVYYVTDPQCAADLNTMARDGTPARLFLAMELPNPDQYRTAPITNWNSVRLASVAGRSAQADLTARLPNWQAEVGTALSAMDKTNAQIFFGTRQFSSVRISRAMKTELEAQGITEPSELGNGATGALAPHAELIVQKFEFDRNAVRGRRAGILIRFMEMFGARLAAGQEISKDGGFRQATYSTAAFKPVTSLFGRCGSQTASLSP